jgi:imidazolonepropionase-like amidohydrolase
MIKNNPVLVNRNREMVKQALAVTARAHKMGVLLVGATDTGYDLVSGFTVASEAATLVQAGLLPMEAIKAITSLAAQLFQVDSYTGSIREGLDADLVVLSANPLEDIRALQGIQMVINNGRIEFRGSR